MEVRFPTTADRKVTGNGEAWTSVPTSCRWSKRGNWVPLGRPRDQSDNDAEHDGWNIGVVQEQQLGGDLHQSVDVVGVINSSWDIPGSDGVGEDGPKPQTFGGNGRAAYGASSCCSWFVLSTLLPLHRCRPLFFRTVAQVLQFLWANLVPRSTVFLRESLFTTGSNRVRGRSILLSVMASVCWWPSTATRAW